MLIKWLGFGSLTIGTGVLVIYELYYPRVIPGDLIFSLILLFSILLGISAPFIFRMRNIKILAWSIFLLALIANCIWYFWTTYPLILFYTVCNLCFMFIYGLFFIQMPYFAIKYQSKFEQTSIRGYHLHEHFYGVLLIILGISCIFFVWVIPIEIGLLRFFMTHILTYFSIFCVILGGFLIGRDYRDLKEFKFIESIKNRVLDPNFNQREHFYHLSQFGIIFTLFGISFVTQHQFLEHLFILDRFFIMGIGLGLIIFGAILSGLNPTYFAKKTDIL